MKKGRFSKEEIEYINNNLDKGLEKIAKKLDRNVEAIQKYVTKPEQKPEPKKEEDEKKAVQEVQNDGFGRLKRGDTVISTVATMAGESRAQELVSGKQKLDPNVIFRPRG